MLAAYLAKNISGITRKNGVIDLLPKDCAMYAAKSRQFQAEDGAQSAQSEHWLIKESERKERKNESAYKTNSADAESD